MLRRAVLAGLLGLSLAVPAAARAGAPTIVPRTFLRGYDPVTLLFDGHPGHAGPEDHPGRFVHLTPSWPGAWRWVDDHTLLFRPANPWPPLARFTVRVGRVRRHLLTLMAPPVKTVPAAGATGLAPVTQVMLAFAEPVAPAALAKMVRLRVRPLPGLADGRHDQDTFIGPEGFSLKALARTSASAPARYVLRLARPIGDGHAISVRLRLGLDGDPHRAFTSVDFATRAPFQVTAAGCLPGPGDPGNRLVPGLLPVTLSGTRYGDDQAVAGGPGAAGFVVRFSAPPSDLDLAEVKQLVRFTPAVAHLGFEVDGHLLRVKGAFVRGRRYLATVGPAPIHDRAGRPLAQRGRTEVPFFFPVRVSYLRLGAGHGVVERYGPKMFPVAGRGDTRVDLRIQKVDPLDRRFWPFPDRPVRVDEARRPPGPGEAPPAPASQRADPSPARIGRWIRLLGSPPVSRVVPLPTTGATGEATFGLDLGPDLARLSGRHAPGTYLVGVRRLTAGTRRAWVRLTVTDLALTTVSRGHQLAFRVTSLSTGRPVAGATVEVQGIPAGATHYAFQTLLQGRTDSRGLFLHEVKAQVHAQLRRVVVRQGTDVLVRAISDPPQTFAQGRWIGHPGGWLSALTEPVSSVGQPLPLAHLIPERPVYRPDDTVHLLGWIRDRVKGRLRVPDARGYRVRITAPDGKTTRLPARADDHGVVAVDFSGTGRPTGGYEADLETADHQTLASARFRLEAYRIPRFHVDLNAPRRVPMDRPFTMSLSAAYYAGGRVAGRPLSWRVTQFPYTWIPGGRPGYLFATDERFSRATRFAPPGAIENHDRTGPDGSAAMKVDPGLELDARPRRYVFEATVTGTDDQTVTAQRTVVALPAFVLGMKTARLVHGARVLTPKLIAVGPDGRPVPGKRLTVRLLSRRWHAHLAETDVASGTPRYVTDVVDRKIYETHLRSAKHPVTVRLPVHRAGVYVIEVSARDRLGRTQVLSVDLYVAGKGAVPWRRPRARVFDTATDEPSYAPGQTAHLLLESPFQSATGLMVVEAPAGNRYVPFVVRGGKATVSLPIDKRFVPEVPVHFVLERGRIAAPARRLDGLDLGKPRTVAATQWVKVRPVANELTVKVDHPKTALPGHTVPLTIHLTTPAGRPVAGEVAVWLVDRAVLSLGHEARLDPLPSLLRKPASGVRIRDTRDAVLGRIPLLEREGGGGEDEAAAPFAHVTVRKVFKTVPYFQARVPVGPSGTATVKVHLAGDLTVFAIRAVAVSGAERFGTYEGALPVRLPVIVQPALPRFVRVGDRFEAAAVARVVEGPGGPGRCQVEVTGGTVGAEAGGCTVRLERGTPARLEVPVTVTPPAATDTGPGVVPELSLKVAVRRDSDGAADAFQVGIPVRPDRRSETRTVFEALAPGRTYAVPGPTSPVRPGSVKRTVLATTRPAILRFASGLDTLLAYQDSCTEQRVSMALPVLALKPLIDRFHLPYDARVRHHTVADTLAWLKLTLGDDGLYAFWPGGTGRVGLTAYVVRFLVAAKAAGIAVPSKLLDPALGALARALRSDDRNLVDGGAFTERADALEALAAAGRFDVSYAGQLAHVAEDADLAGGARVLLAFNDGQMGDSTLARRVAASLFAGTVFVRHHGQLAFDGLQRPRTFASPLVLFSRTSTQAQMIRALWPQHAADPRLALMVDDLLRQGTGDGWGDTFRNAQVLLALGEVLGGDTGPSPSTRLTFRHDGHTQALPLGAGTPTAYAVTGDAGKASLAVPASAPGTLAARLTLSFVPKATGDRVRAESHGFVVRREVRRVPASGDGPLRRTWLDRPGRRLAFHVGDVEETHVQVVSPAKRHYVVIAVPLAAGMEPMNPSLATAPAAARPSQAPTLKPTYVQYLDDVVRFYFETLPAGTFDFYYRVRAATAGDFAQPPARAEMMYHPEIRGRSNGARVVVTR